MVGRLVENQKIRREEERSRECHAFFLAARHRVADRFRVADTERGEQFFCRRRRIFAAHLAARHAKAGRERSFRREKLRILRKKANLQPLSHNQFAAVRTLLPRQDAKQGRFSGSVYANQRQLLALSDIAGGVVEKLACRINLF